ERAAAVGADQFERAAGEADAPRAPHRARDRAERRRLAGAVGAEHGDDRALLDRERDPVQHVDGAVARLDVLELEECRHAASSPPRYAWITAGSRCTSAGPPAAVVRRTYRHGTGHH